MLKFGSCRSYHQKAFIKDAGFGDCPMEILYEFQDDSGEILSGKYTATESSFYNVEVGSRILIRYLKSDPKKNAPRDSLSIIESFSDTK